MKGAADASPMTNTSMAASVVAEIGPSGRIVWPAVVNVLFRVAMAGWFQDRLLPFQFPIMAACTLAVAKTTKNKAFQILLST